ncbi:MAG: MoaD/ThiS family protein [Deltaproteobacteria bacterium]|nr:MoaD/ThiS family protein [Candidatus Zymogenaceae bacterium]
MEILVKLHYVLRTYAPGRDFKRPFALTLAKGAVLGEVIRALELPNDQEFLLFVGSRHAVRDQVLVEGDTVTILPPIIGG